MHHVGQGLVPPLRPGLPRRTGCSCPTPTDLGQDPPGPVSSWGPQAGAQKVAGLRMRQVLHPRPGSPCAGCAFRAAGFSMDMQAFGY